MPGPIERAARILKRGGVAAFPTETVYGLGALLTQPRGLRKIYAVKGRPSDNPLIVHIHSLAQFDVLTRHVPPEAFKLIQTFWPGPLTLVCKKSALVPKTVTAGLDTVAVRMPRHPVALKLLRAAGAPVAAPSANRSGRPSPTRFQDVKRELKGRVNVIIDGGRARAGLESTVLDVTRKPFRVLRPGVITLEDLNKIVPRVVAVSGGKTRGAAASPGMKHRHYQPSCKVILAGPKEWHKALARLKNKKLGVVALTQTIPVWKNIVYRKHLRGDRKAYARELYATFFEAEKAKVEALLVESMDHAGVGRAVMDRLLRASN